jgi:hypothetical protein
LDAAAAGAAAAGAAGAAGGAAGGGGWSANYALHTGGNLNGVSPWTDIAKNPKMINVLGPVWLWMIAKAWDMLGYSQIRYKEFYGKLGGGNPRVKHNNKRLLFLFLFLFSLSWRKTDRLPRQAQDKKIIKFEKLQR